MAREYFSADGLILNETTNKEYFSGIGGSVFNETSGSSPTTIDCTIGNAVADGSLATINQINNIVCTIGNAVADGSLASVSNNNNVNCTVGDAVANGSIATINQEINIICSVGNAVADGLIASVTTGDQTVINCSVGNAVANGSLASVVNYIVTDVIINNTGTIRSNQAVSYTWWPSGRIGSMTSITPTDGTGTTNGAGKLVTNIPVAAGVLMIAVLNAGATTDDVYYEAK